MLFEKSSRHSESAAIVITLSSGYLLGVLLSMHNFCRHISDIRTNGSISESSFHFYFTSFPHHSNGSSTIGENFPIKRFSGWPVVTILYFYSNICIWSSSNTLRWEKMECCLALKISVWRIFNHLVCTWCHMIWFICVNQRVLTDICNPNGT